MSKGLIKLIVFFVIDLDDSVSDQERVALVFSKLFVANLGRPTSQVLAIEELNPLLIFVIFEKRTFLLLIS